MFSDGRCQDMGTPFMMGDTSTNIQVDPNLDMGKCCGMGGDPMMSSMGSGCTMQPIYEPVQERCVHRQIIHEIPHVCPINTRVINHHICKHTFSPMYTCCEENQLSSVQCGSCCNFR